MNIKKIITILFGTVTGSVMTLIFGFSTGLWLSGSGSVLKGEAIAQQAVIERLTPMCFAQFKLDSNKQLKLVELKKTNSWNRAKYVSDQGWATMPFEKEFDSGVAKKCWQLIVETN